MATYNFHGDINGPGNFGERGVITIGRQEPATDVLRLAADLVQRLHAEGAEQPRIEAADTLCAELDQAAGEGRSADPGLVRRALETITLGLAASSGALALAQEISRLLGF